MKILTRIKKKKINKHKQKNAQIPVGFTLIELLVALAVFTIACSIIAGIFVSIVNSQRKIVGLANVQASASFILESIAKEIRMSVINSSLSTDSPISTLIATNSRGENVTYEFVSANKNLTRKVDSNPSQAVNPDDISLTGSFYIQKTSFPVRTKVTIFLRAESKGIKSTQKAAMDLETSVTPRGPQE
ncbi:prepilin-type N-terminal cleavage/methylation domain-containing protein [Candidatus Falkowbacteria bacterium]|nr:prepilin-type N-terminal cleavage/methylation domain-containing protein [Candidatus Falkowbacteria bacterium]